jgi:Na+/melibiose symporter-like transporter
LVKIFAAGAAMYAVARGGLWLMGAGTGFMNSAVILIFVGGAALAAYFGTSLLLKVEELGSTTTLLRKRSASA